jgi:predicted DNA-binding protein
MQQRKINSSFTIELSQLERLDALSKRTRIPKSEIVRNALERELTKYDQEQQAAEAESDGRRKVGAGAGRRVKTSRRV